jgi:cytochrome bd-type quinol oxidase subunit 2
VTRNLAIAGFLALMVVLGTLSWLQPGWLSDNNKFLGGFVNQELLAVLGVIVTITLASAASLHLELNRLEDAHGEQFIEARAATKGYAYLLIWLFLAALALVTMKPIVAATDRAEAICNSIALLIIVLNVMSLIDLTGAVFQIPARRRITR